MSGSEGVFIVLGGVVLLHCNVIDPGDKSDLPLDQTNLRSMVEIKVVAWEHAPSQWVKM